MITSNADEQEYLRRRAVQNVRAHVRRLRIVITLPINIALFVLFEWAVGAYQFWPLWRSDGHGQSDFGSFVVFAWFLILVIHTVLAMVNIGWEVIVRREMGKIRRTEAQYPAAVVESAEKAKRVTRLSDDGEIVEEENLQYGDNFPMGNIHYHGTMK